MAHGVGGMQRLWLVNSHKKNSVTEGRHTQEEGAELQKLSDRRASPPTCIIGQAGFGNKAIQYGAMGASIFNTWVLLMACVGSGLQLSSGSCCDEPPAWLITWESGLLLRAIVVWVRMLRLVHVAGAGCCMTAMLHASRHAQSPDEDGQASCGHVDRQTGGHCKACQARQAGWHI